MTLYCEICKRDRGQLNKVNWKRHIDACKIKNNKKHVITPPPSDFSIANYFFKKRKIEETIVSGMLSKMYITYLNVLFQYFMMFRK